MNERVDPKLTTAEIAAAGRGATLERDHSSVREPVDAREGEDTRPHIQPKPAPGAAREEFAQLFSEEEAHQLRSRWEETQTRFVDEPRRTVEQADALVAQVMKRLAEVFADERSQLESQWTRGDDVSTEDLRVALRRYRSFFHRLLSI